MLVSVLVSRYNAQMDKYICYVYEDSKPNGEVFYVGIGDMRRVKLIHRNPWHTKIIQKHPEWKRTIVASMFCFESAKQIEKERIFLYGRRNKKQGTLVNLTDGGDGILGFVFSSDMLERKSKSVKEAMAKPESKAKRSKITSAYLAVTEIKQRQRNGLIEYYKKPETKEKIKAMFASESYKLNHVVAIKKSWQNKERKEKASKTISKTWEIERVREKRLRGMNKHLSSLTQDQIKNRVSVMHTAEAIARNRESIKKSFSNPETRKRQVDASQLAFKRPEVIAKKSASLKEFWKMRKIWAEKNGYNGKLGGITLKMMERAIDCP